ncbi:NAD(P)/FAD-dependent oxidoreductase [Nocardia asteroides]|uniref:NAD(P)/FAD-dependent oxidoreductase n=1 Tax=Nocardia asteroides TaxID=1824 RepID=UPI0037CA8193
MNAASTAIVVGAGVVGLSIADQLARRGVNVTVLESTGVAAGASYGNAGWVNPAQTGPLPEPGLLRNGLRHLRSVESPSQTAIGDYPKLLPWLMSFVRNASTHRYRSGALALAELGKRSFPLLDQLAADGVEFNANRTGFLAVARDHHAAQAFRRARQPFAAAGFAVSERVIEGDELRELEPALSPKAQYGVEVAEHVQLDPGDFVTALAAHLRARGVQIDEGVEVTGIVGIDGHLCAVDTRLGRRQADLVVFATGVNIPLTWLRLPIIGGRGYSFEVPIRTALTRSVLLLDAHIACAPLKGRLRVAGGMDFGPSARLSEARLDAIAAGAAPMLDGIDWSQRRHGWSGLRPLAPDGLPVIDRLPGYTNAYLATGFSMLGMTLASPAAEALAEYIFDGTRPGVLEPFRVSRLR